jgi:hypothetical protein
MTPLEPIDQFSDSRGGYRTFHHLAAPKMDLYRSILRVFGQAKEHFEISLRPAEVVERLAAGSVIIINAEELSQALEKLHEWGNLDASQDNSEVQTVEEFKRPRFLYQFTAAGEATEQALATFDQHFRRPGELQTTALRSIQDTLDELQRLLDADELDGAKAVRALRELTDRFHQLVTRAQSFMRTVQRSIDAPSSELDLFLQHKEALLSYVERFVGELVMATFRVSTSLRRIEASSVERALSFAADTATRRAPITRAALRHLCLGLGLKETALVHQERTWMHFGGALYGALLNLAGLHSTASSASSDPRLASAADFPHLVSRFWQTLEPLCGFGPYQSELPATVRRRAVERSVPVQVFRNWLVGLEDTSLSADQQTVLLG